MIDAIWSAYVILAWVVIGIWMAPTIIARRRGQRNTVAIFVLSVIFSIIPETIVSLGGFVVLLVFSLYRGPDTVVVQGPKGDSGSPGLSCYQIYVLNTPPDEVLTPEAWLESLRGKDADEIPLSKAGVVKPRKRS